MKVVNCPTCGAEMPGNGKCSNCAHVKGQAPGKKEGKGYLVETIMGLVLVGLIYWGYTAFTGQENEPGEYEANLVGARVAMEFFVEKRLKSPSTADFAGGMSKDSVTYLGEQRYFVEDYVDSQNSFGATIRTRYHGIVREGNEDWILESLEFEE